MKWFPRLMTRKELKLEELREKIGQSLDDFIQETEQKCFVNLFDALKALQEMKTVADHLGDQNLSKEIEVEINRQTEMQFQYLLRKKLR